MGRGGGGGGKARDLIERDTRRQRHTDKQTDRESKSEKYALEIRIRIFIVPVQVYKKISYGAQ